MNLAVIVKARLSVSTLPEEEAEDEPHLHPMPARPDGLMEKIGERMFPIGDDNSDRVGTPIVNYLLIAINVLVFVFLQGMGGNDRFTYAYSTVPQEIVTGRDEVTQSRTIQDPISGSTFRAPGLEPTPVSVYLTLLTSMFMHGGLAHLFGNMLYLWIFGNNIEDVMGHVRFVIFYVVCGIAAVFSHAITNPGSDVPMVGASGGISGILGVSTSLSACSGPCAFAARPLHMNVARAGGRRAGPVVRHANSERWNESRARGRGVSRSSLTSEGSSPACC